MGRTLRVKFTGQKDGRWLTKVPKIGVVEAGSLPSLHGKVRTAVHGEPTMADVQRLVIDFEFGDAQLAAETAGIREIRAEIEKLEAGLAERTAAAACKLVYDYGMSARDTAMLLGVSYQRVQQLAPRDNPPGRP